MPITTISFKDIHGAQAKGLETFVKTDFNKRGEESGGVIYEEDPARHPQLAKQLLPAFSNRSMGSLRTMEPTLHMHIDLFIAKMKANGDITEGVSLVDWTNWMTMEIAANMAYYQKMRELEEEKNSLYLQILLDFNVFSPVIWVFKRFILFKPFENLFLPWSKMQNYAAFRRHSEAQLGQRIERRGATDHLDYFEQLFPSGGDVTAQTPRDMAGLGVAARQLVFAGYQPVSEWMYATLFYLTYEPDAYAALVTEIRDTFHEYVEIRSEALASLPYLNACLHEALRLFPGNNSGLPRISPGATIDGIYVPEGVYVQTSFLASGGASRYFHEGTQFRPQRFLPPDHKLYDTKFVDDACNDLFPFSFGPRACLGKALAWEEGRLIIAKLLWSLNITQVPGQHVNLEKQLKTYGFWVKPELKIRFTKVEKA